MSSESTRSQWLLSSLDLVTVLLVTAATDVLAVLPGIQDTSIRAAVGFCFVVFVPGYAIVAALFPERHEASATGAESDRVDDSEQDGLTGLERVIWSFGLSLIVAPVLGFALSALSLGFGLLPVLGGLSLITVFATAAAIYRRAQLPVESTYPGRLSRWREADLDGKFQASSRGAKFAVVCLVAMTLLSTVWIGYVLTTPAPSDSYTEFYLLTPDENGSLVIPDSTTLSPGTESQLIIGVTNHEHESIDYTVITQVQRVERTNESLRVLNRQRIGEFSPSLDHNETWRHNQSVRLSEHGDSTRVVYLLYHGSLQSPPRIETADQYLQLWAGNNSS